MSTSPTTVRNAQPCCAPSCCNGSSPEESSPAAAEDVREKVREGYGRIARSGSSSALAAPAAAASSCCAGSESKASGGCCGGSTFSPEQLAAAVGYSDEELAATPEEANMGLSCGNPTALASLRPGEVVVDLGAGGGFDCFIAGRRVGPTGRVIGVDMTPDMLTRARRNTATYRAQTTLDNVEFRLGEIENLPLADGSADVVISNCVVNLSPDKPRVWREAFRVLKRGGRVAISDLALLKPLPESVRRDVEALVGCIAGAVPVEDTRRMAAEAGFTDIVLNSRPQYIRSMADWQDPLYQRIRDSLPPGTGPADYITSLEVTARKA